MNCLKNYVVNLDTYTGFAEIFFLLVIFMIIIHIGIMIQLIIIFHLLIKQRIIDVSSQLENIKYI